MITFEIIDPYYDWWKNNHMQCFEKYGEVYLVIDSNDYHIISTFDINDNDTLLTFRGNTNVILQQCKKDFVLNTIFQRIVY